MKRFLFASLALALIAASPSFAQNKGGYTDDVYYTGSQAEREAQQQAQQVAEQQSSAQNAPYYNSSGQDNYQNNDNNAQAYNNGDYSSDNNGYIDYDDDSYTTRIRRFYYPMNDIGYWGSVYAPYWSSPFYANPYYGWGGWYTPGISMSFGFGPYWSNDWGMNTWFGYGGFNSWYAPYYGYGWGGGYGAGYWNGYYSGIYDGAYHNNAYNRLNYGPRGSRNNVHAVGNYGRNSRTAPINKSGMVNPQRGSVRSTQGRNMELRSNNGARQISNRSVFQTNSAQRNTSDNNGTIRLKTDDGNRQMVSPQQNSRNRGIFNFDREGNSRNLETRMPQQSSQRENIRREAAPVRTYTPPARTYSEPSRSYSAPSRSYSAPSRGGGGGAHRR